MLDLLKLAVLIGIVVLSLRHRLWLNAMVAAVILFLTGGLAVMGLLHKHVPVVADLVRQGPVVVWSTLLALPVVALVYGTGTTRPRTPAREPIDLFWIVVGISVIQIAIAFALG